MIEVINNHVDPNIPTRVYDEGITILKNYEMQSSKKVNDALVGISTQLQGEGWYLDKPQKAYFSFQVSLPIVGQAGPFSLIILYFEGNAFRIFNPTKDPPDEDPSGDIIPGVGPNGQNAVVVGVPVNSAMGQNEIIQALGDKMKLSAPDYKFLGADPITDPDNGLFGVNQTIFIEAESSGADFNDLGGTGNVVGGGQFNGVAKYGGYDLNSPPTGDNRLKLTMWNNPTSNFTFRPHFISGPRGNPESPTVFSVLPERVMHKRDNYICFCGPRQWGIFPAQYLPFPITSIVDVLQGVSDYHFCGPRVPDNQSNEAVVGIGNAITYTGFMMSTPRNKLNESSDAATCVNDKFQVGAFAGLDAGVSYLAYNSMYHSAGALRTTSLKSIKYSAVICLSPGNSFFNRARNLPGVQSPALVYAFVPNMYMTSEAVPYNTEVVDPSNRRTYIAYRVQTDPCECTLWVG